MTFHSIRRLITTAAGLLLVAGLASAGTIVIDDFSKNANQSAILAPAPGTSSNTMTGISTANTIGGSRQLDLVVSSGTQIDTLFVDTTNKQLSLNLGSGDVGSGTVTYDANGTSLGATFLTTLSSTTADTFFQANIKFSDLNLGLVATFTDGLGNIATFSTTLGSGVSFVNQAFSGFSNAGAVNFDNIKSISVKLDGPAAQDGTISFLEITTTPSTGAPEPATMAMLGSALVGLGLLGRKRLAR